MIYAILLVAISCLVTSSRANFIVMAQGTCPDVPVQQDFDRSRYLGRWYSYEDFDVPYQFMVSCITAEYTMNRDSTIKVVNRGSRRVSLFGRTLWSTPVVAEGVARIVNESRPAGLTVQFGDQPLPADGQPNYRVVSTDYVSYSLVYSCFQPTPLPFRIDAAWILTRARGRKPENINSLKLILAQYGINTDNFKLVDNKDC